MSKNVNIGDWLCFGGMGAYTYTAKSTFNGMQAGNKTYIVDINVNNKVFPSISENV